MPDILRKYVDDRILPLSGSVEGTLNAILEDLAEREENVVEGLFRSELISACAVILNGLSRIRDPVRLFRNLGSAFERRQGCIYTDTVVNAFNRLYLVAVKQGKGEEILHVWRGFNPLTRGYAAKYIPVKEFKMLFARRGFAVSTGAVRALVSRKDLSIDELREFLSHPDPLVREHAASALISRRDFSVEEAKKLLSHPDSAVKTGAVGASSSSREFPLKRISGERSARKRDVRKRMRVLRR